MSRSSVALSVFTRNAKKQLLLGEETNVPEKSESHKVPSSPMQAPYTAHPSHTLAYYGPVLIKFMDLPARLMNLNAVKMKIVQYVEQFQLWHGRNRYLPSCVRPFRIRGQLKAIFASLYKRASKKSKSMSPPKKSKASTKSKAEASTWFNGTLGTEWAERVVDDSGAGEEVVTNLCGFTEKMIAEGHYSPWIGHGSATIMPPDTLPTKDTILWNHTNIKSEEGSVSSQEDRKRVKLAAAQKTSFSAQKKKSGRKK